MAEPLTAGFGMPSLLPVDYAPWLAQIKARVQAARTRAVLAVQRELFLAEENLLQVVRELPWGHALTLTGQVKSYERQGKGNTDLFGAVRTELVEVLDFSTSALRQACPEHGRRAQGERG